MKTVKLTDAQFKFTKVWLMSWECSTHCDSGKCHDCKLVASSLKAFREAE